ncbi:hypothetical protein FRB90_002777 [Tulasnella sp. 427]|nr:hypothetical protein FRB90_002777 [Tulasnella sp. 427]
MLPHGLDDGRSPRTWIGRRSLPEAIKYIAVGCAVTVCTFLLMPSFGATNTPSIDPGIVVPESQPVRNAISAFDPSLLDPRLYVKGPPTGRFRDNLRNEFKYATVWNYAGMTNDFMAVINMIYLAYMSHRIPIVPPFLPSHSHVGRGVKPMPFSDIFDLPRLREALQWPILEWSDVKKAKYDVNFDEHHSEMEGADKEILGCWGAQQAFDKNNRPTHSLTSIFLNLEVVYTPVPFFTKLQPKYPPDTHVSFAGLASILRPIGRAEALASPAAKNHTSFVPHLKNTFEAPDEQLACFDNMYFVAERQAFEWEQRQSPAWNLVGTEARFNPKLEDMASEHLKKVFGSEEVPMYISVHIRRTDFKNQCKGLNPKECFAPLSAYGERIKEVQEELAERYGSNSPRGNVKEVLVSSDESDPEFWAEVKAVGWKFVDYEAMGTVKEHGLWYPPLLDVVMHARGAGFVGTERSTMSLVAIRRVSDWRGGPSPIIGSGLAGLSAAYYLSQENQRRSEVGDEPLFEVHLFEKAPALGMDSASISVLLTDGKSVRVDVPMRSFQEAYYSNLVQLYREIGVGFRPAHFTYSFSTIRKSRKGTTKETETPWLETTLLYNGRSGFKGVSRPGSASVSGCTAVLPLMGQLVAFVVSTFFLLVNYLRLLVLSVPHRLWAPSRTERLDEWMRRTTPRNWISRRLGFDESWKRFVGEVLVPLFSCVCTSTIEDVWAMPVEEVLDYIYLGLFTPNYVASHGVQDVVARLAASLDSNNVHLSSTITSITLDPSNPTYASVHFNQSTYGSEGANADEQSLSGFSHVVIATQANQAIPILSIPSKASVRPIRDIISCLGNFEYRRNIVVNHTDDSLAPPNAADRRILNFICSESRSKISTNPMCVPQDYAMATHIVYPSPSTSPNSPSSQTIYQTTNPIYPPSPSSIISVSRMERAIVTTSSKFALQDLFRDAEDAGKSSQWNWLGLKKRKRKTLGPLQGVSTNSSSIGQTDGNDRGPRIWLCGSYAFAGIPLLEGCVASARLVVQQGIVAGGISSSSRS